MTTEAMLAELEERVLAEVAEHLANHRGANAEDCYRDFRSWRREITQRLNASLAVGVPAPHRWFVQLAARCVLAAATLDAQAEQVQLSERLEARVREAGR
jgi:hypothetical protein